MKDHPEAVNVAAGTDGVRIALEQNRSVVIVTVDEGNIAQTRIVLENDTSWSIPPEYLEREVAQKVARIVLSYLHQGLSL